MGNQERDNLVSEGKQNIISFIKNRIFDFLGIAILIAMFALMLNILEGKDFTLQSLKEVLLQLAPFYICAMMLSLNYYKKGAYSGKNTPTFTDEVSDYNDVNDELTGNQIRHLREFCKVYNDESLRDMQEAILSKEGVSYNEFLELRKLKYFKTRKLKGSLIANAIKKAKRVKIVGIEPNILLGNRKSDDATDLGPSETHLMTGRAAWYAIGYIFTIGFLMFLAVKDITEWSWKVVLYQLVKVIYIFVRSYMRYFEGYEDITIKLRNTIHRKTCILKSYKAWYNEKNYSDENDEEKTTPTENNDD